MLCGFGPAPAACRMQLKSISLPRLYVERLPIDH
jgi:hypothetical protein